MILHNDRDTFTQLIDLATKKLGISPVFVEKDYWITLVLYQLAQSKYAAETVFKGGTSLAKGHLLLERFSEDVDVAVINRPGATGNTVKNIIRTAEKKMTKGLQEIAAPNLTSKGSRFRKSVFEYESIHPGNHSNRLIVEINSFANPFPFRQMPIKSFVHDYLLQSGNEKYIATYQLQPFTINVLAKEQTLLEKLVSLIRVSFEEKPVESIAGKIRHFYDLYFLLNDQDVAAFTKSAVFKKQFTDILEHDRQLFDEPVGWKEKPVKSSPLLKDFEAVWKQLKGIYTTELSALAYTVIPNENKVATRFKELMKLIQ